MGLRLPWLLNGSLPTREAGELQNHLSNCERCREDWERTVEFAGIFDTHVSSLDLSAFAHGIELDAESMRAIREHLEECPACEAEVAWIRDQVRAGRGPSRWVRWAAAAAIVFTFGFLTERSRRSDLGELSRGDAPMAASARTTPTEIPEKEPPTLRAGVDQQLDSDGHIERVLFVDGFESGSTSFWGDPRQRG